MAKVLALISDFIACARSYVPRDRQHDLLYRPRPEVGTRLGKELGKLLLALALVRGKTHPDAEDLRTVARVAEDCLPPNRLAVLRALATAEGPVKVAQIVRAARLPWTTTKQTLEDLEVLEIVSGIGPDNSLDAEDDRGWSISPAWQDALQTVPLLRQVEVGE